MPEPHFRGNARSTHVTTLFTSTYEPIFAAAPFSICGAVGGQGQNAIVAASIAFSLQSPITALPTNFHNLIRTFIHPFHSGEQFYSFYSSVHSFSLLFCSGPSFHFHLSRLLSIFTSFLDCCSSTNSLSLYRRTSPALFLESDITETWSLFSILFERVQKNSLDDGQNRTALLENYDQIMSNMLCKTMNAFAAEWQPRECDAKHKSNTPDATRAEKTRSFDCLSCVETFRSFPRRILFHFIRFFSWKWFEFFAVAVAHLLCVTA